MRIINFFQMNDWEMKKFLIFIFSLQTALLCLLIFDDISFNLPFLRELISIIYLFFIPGFLILRIMKLHNLGDIQSIVYSVSLSIASVMFVGFLLNLCSKIVGIINPISLVPITVALLIFTSILSVISYFLDKDFSNTKYINLEYILSPYTLSIILIPFLAIFGTYLVGFSINLVLIFLLLLIAIIVVLVAFNKIPAYLYPLTIFVIALSLLLHTSLLSNHLWGWDIHVEYYYSNLVLSNSYWDIHIQGNTNSVLPITILIPIISILSDINLVWVFKIIPSLLFSLVPLGLYEIFKNQSNKKIAFLASFFFMSIYSFYTEMPMIVRQEIAEIFLVMLILLLINYQIPKIKRSTLLIISIFAIAVSHYGLSYILMLMFITVFLIVYIVQTSFFKALMNKTKDIILVEKLFPKSYLSNTSSILTITFILLFITFSLGWYIYISGSSSFETIIRIFDHITSNIVSDFLNPETSQGLAVINVVTSSILHDIAKYLNLLFQFFIVVGVISVLRLPNKFKKEYLVFVIVSLFILLLSIIVPYFASSINLTRIYHITLFFLAPFAIIGGINFFKLISILLRKNWDKQKSDISLKFIAILSCLMFLFFSGFIYEITGDDPTSFAISNVDSPMYSYQEVVGASWPYRVGEKGFLIYADQYRSQLFREFSTINIYNYPENPKKIVKNSYWFFGKYNLMYSKILINNTVSEDSYVGMKEYTKNKNEIYDNGMANIFYLKVI